MKKLISLLYLSSCVAINNQPREHEIPGAYYQVKSGDNLDSICKSYRVNRDEVKEINGINNADLLTVGKKIYLPNADPIIVTIKESMVKTKPPSRAEPKKTLKILDFPIPHSAIVRHFSLSKQNPYEGIAIKAPRHTPIRAAHKGRVLFVGDDNTRYGLIVIIEHPHSLITVYAHLEKALVTKNEEISQKQIIGTVGDSGGIAFTHLHFQVRLEQKPQNPINFFSSKTFLQH
jgi:murein DD-endopeptidase MepM/ murein hydrolase activator NlpD